MALPLTVVFEIINGHGDAAIARTSINHHRLNWSWKVSRRNFDEIYGSYKIAMLVPDKIAKAYNAVVQSPLTPDDFSEVLDQFENLNFLQQTYTEASRLHGEPQIPEDLDSDLEVVCINMQPFDCQPPIVLVRPLSLYATLSQFNALISQFRTLFLGEPNQAFILEKARQLVDFTQDLVLMCRTYLNMAHPVWVLQIHKTHFDKPKVDEVRNDCITRLLAIKAFFTRRFEYTLKQINDSCLCPPRPFREPNGDDSDPGLPPLFYGCSG